MDSKPTVERRHAQRRTTRVEAVLLQDGARTHVMILDYQKTGLQLWVRKTLIPGTEVQLSIAGRDLTARVQWSDGRNAGVALLHPLDVGVQRLLNDAKDAVT